jgi:hypothetical protein
VFPPADFNRLGMSEGRWERIWSALSFECNDDKWDKWGCIRKFIGDGMYKKQKCNDNRSGERVRYEDSRRSKQLKCTICGRDSTTLCNV